MPLGWSEVKKGLDPSRFTLVTAPQRMAAVIKDPLRPVLDVVPDLGRALARLGELLKRSGG
jgi:DNA primase